MTDEAYEQAWREFDQKHEISANGKYAKTIRKAFEAGYEAGIQFVAERLKLGCPASGCDCEECRVEGEWEA